MTSSNLEGKKRDESFVEHHVASTPDSPSRTLDEVFGGVEARKRLEKKLLRKVDLRMSILVIIYILNYIDRNNASAARLQGFEEDLGLEGEQFATIISILFVGYILMQIPSNMFLNYIGKPSLYLPICMLLWGMISVLTGITHNFVGALLTRFFLGFVEAAFFPGALFLISKWYKRDEIGKRTAILYCGNIISNGLGALIASGILSGMDGILGYTAWRWLFFVEGALTMFFAVVAMLILPDFPETTRWLSAEEKTLAIERLKEDVGIADTAEAEPEHAGAGLVLAVKDWRVWWLAIIMTLELLALSFNAYFPTLAATMGFDETITLVLCAPPWILTALIAYFWSRHSDKTRERFFHILIPQALGLLGFIIAISTMNTAARYVALFLMCFSYAGIVCLYAWISNSFPRPPAKRAVVLALTNCISQLGSFAGSYIWPKEQFGPTYRNSYGICVAALGAALVMLWVFRASLMRLNRKLQSDEEEAEQTGKNEVGFRYIV